MAHAPLLGKERVCVGAARFPQRAGQRSGELDDRPAGALDMTIAETSGSDRDSVLVNDLLLEVLCVLGSPQHLVGSAATQRDELHEPCSSREVTMRRGHTDKPSLWVTVHHSVLRGAGTCTHKGSEVVGAQNLAGNFNA